MDRTDRTLGCTDRTIEKTENPTVAGGPRTLAQLEPPWQESADSSQIHFNEGNVPIKPK